MLETGPGNTPTVRVLTTESVLFGARVVQKPNPWLPGGPNPDPYHSSWGLCQIWLDASVVILGSAR